VNIRRISGPPSPELARELAVFEEPFTYPLGVGRFFRISHGADYTLFFRAQGDAVCFIAENDGHVVGALGTAIRSLWMPEGGNQTVAYFGDLKVAQQARGGLVLIRLARAAEACLRPKVRSGFGVVMGGTSLTPGTYTGRAGIPDFKELAKLTILRISKGTDNISGIEQRVTTPERGLECYRRLSHGRYACPAGATAQRSEMTPVWLVTPDGSACGLLEDTRKAKRLISDDGLEMLSAHLSCFAYSDVATASRLIGAGLNHALHVGLPSVFVSVAEGDAQLLTAALNQFAVHPAPATVYGTGLEPGCWNINTAEI
jgi:hypothetical protein